MALRRLRKIPARWPKAETPPPRVELEATCQPRVHELDFVEHPEAVIVEQAKLKRPAGPPSGVATVQRSRQEHVLCADQDRVALRPHGPVSPLLTTQQKMNGNGALPWVVVAGGPTMNVPRIRFGAISALFAAIRSNKLGQLR